jgi:enolase
MTTLTKEYFDQRLNKVEKNMEDEIHGLAAMTAKGFDDIIKRLDVHERVEKLEKKMAKVETALNVRL